MSFSTGVSSTQFRNLPRSLGQAIHIADGRKNEGKEEPGEYKLTLTDPAPEVYVRNQIAAVWAALHRMFPDGSMPFRTYASVNLVKPDGEGWKVSGFAHSHPAPGTPLPSVGKEMTPEVERLVSFTEVGCKERGIKNLEDWAVPGARVVWYRLPGPPATLSIEEAVGQILAGLAKLPADAEWQEDFEDVTIRIAGNTGFIWMHFATFISGKPQSIGIDVLSLHQQDDK